MATTRRQLLKSGYTWVESMKEWHKVVEFTDKDGLAHPKTILRRDLTGLLLKSVVPRALNKFCRDNKLNHIQ